MHQFHFLSSNECVVFTVSLFHYSTFPLFLCNQFESMSTHVILFMFICVRCTYLISIIISDGNWSTFLNFLKMKSNKKVYKTEEICMSLPERFCFVAVKFANYFVFHFENENDVNWLLCQLIILITNKTLQCTI